MRKSELTVQEQDSIEVPLEELIEVFQGGYDRIGTIHFTEGTCDVCKEDDKKGVGIDASEGEYNEGMICFSCCTKIGKEKEKFKL